MAKAAANVEKLDLGKIIQTTVGLVVRNRASLFIVSLMFSVIPAIINYIISSNNISQNGMPKNISITIVVWIFYVLFSSISHASSTLIVRQYLEDQPNQLGKSIQTALQNIAPIFIVSLLSMLAYLLGLFFLVVPGIMIGCAFSVSVPVQVLESPTGLTAFRRSRDLTRGNRWRIFGLTLAFFAFYFALTFLFSVPFGGLISFTDVKSLGTQIRLPVLGLFSGMFLGPGLAVLYFELRRIREGVGATDLATVFD